MAMNIKQIWSIQPPSAIHVDAPQDVCMSVLSKAARPSIDQLHLRDTFAEGRRYFIETTADGFRMTTTSKSLINRRRTESLTVLRAQVFNNGDHGTSIVFRGHVRPVGFLSTFWIPTGMIWLLWPVPWPRMFVVGLLTVIFAFAWAGLRYGAALEITEMIYFIHKAFENVPKFAPVALPAPNGTGDNNGDFDVLWDQFVRAHQSET
jgi:hypothetical protein